MPSPFLAIPEDRWIAANALAFAIRDGHPVTEGHALVIPRREILSWWEATPEERAAIFQLVDVVKAQLDAEFAPDGYNIGFNSGTAAGQTVEHLHLHVIPRRRGDVPDPRGGVRWVIPSRANYLDPLGPLRLLTGESAALEGELIRCIETPHYDRIDLVVSFVMMSGLARIAGALQDALDRDARVRLLTTDYLDVTDPAALAWLLDQSDRGDAPGTLATRVFTGEGLSFHAKAYLFASSSRTAVRPSEAFVGSSNLSRSGLAGGIEWNLATTEAKPMFEAFERLWNDPRSHALTRAWIADYAQRRPPAPARAEFSAVREPAPDGVAPLPVQREALQALERTRAEGYRAGLVVMATGLGKTWLAAFDSARPAEFRRVLFVAHREEILRQSRDVFRRVQPKAELGLFFGSEKSPEASVLFASIQTLARHLDRFAPDTFDYVVVDEFHHAAAASYRKVLDHFAPKFLLGLTATPERMDGADLLALCGENLVFRCDLVEGIRRKNLSPFSYFGLKDVVDFQPIPWRNGKFDAQALTRAFETHQRATQALNEWRARAGRRTLAFCVTTTHADFMARFFQERGIPSAAVHSAPTSAPRHASIEQLRAGDVRVLFSVDIFNEGFDMPDIDTVMMLRPTESPVIFLQQLGRGLRPSATKERLTVIDFIGNHKSFLLKPRTLLSLGRAMSPPTRAVLQAVQSGEFELPEGCSVAYDLEVFDMLRALARADRKSALEDFCWTHFEEEGMRPTAAQALRAGYNPRAVRRSDGGWFHYLADLGLLEDAESSALPAGGSFLRALEVEPTTKSYKLVTLRAMIHQGKLLTGMEWKDLAQVAHDLVRRDPRLLRDVTNNELPDPAHATTEQWQRYWRKWPIAAWLGELKDRPGEWFELEGETFRPRFAIPDEHADAFTAMAAELLEYLLARYFSNRPSDEDGPIRMKVSHSGGNPIVRFDRARFPEIPEGKAIEFVAEDRTYLGDFMKIALNVAHVPGERGNALHSLLRGWFGPSAGLPGTDYHVVMERARDTWVIQPEARETGVHGQLVLPHFTTYRVACSAFGQPDPGTHAPTARKVTLAFEQAGVSPSTHFLACARGDSMAGGPDPIRHGDFLLLEWLKNAPLTALIGQRVLVEYRAPEGTTAALKLLSRDASGKYSLESANVEHPPIPGVSGMRPVARLDRKLDQREINPLAPHLHHAFARKGVPPLYGETFNEGKWNSGHISLDGKIVLFVTLQKTKDMSGGTHYTDRLDAPDLLTWSSQTSTTQRSKKGRDLIESLDRGTDIELWLRRHRRDDFTYAGWAVLIDVRGNRPMLVRMRLLTPLPGDLFRGLGGAS